MLGTVTVRVRVVCCRRRCQEACDVQAEGESDCADETTPLPPIRRQVDMTHTVNQFYFDEIHAGGERIALAACTVLPSRRDTYGPDTRHVDPHNSTFRL